MIGTTERKRKPKRRFMGNDGIEQKIMYIAQQSEDTEQSVDEIQKENKTLRREVDLLKAIVIKSWSKTEKSPI
jgi:regulator of replication initiation timing